MKITVYLSGKVSYNPLSLYDGWPKVDINSPWKLSVQGTGLGNGRHLTFTNEACLKDMGESKRVIWCEGCSIKHSTHPAHWCTLHEIVWNSGNELHTPALSQTAGAS